MANYPEQNGFKRPKGLRVGSRVRTDVGGRSTKGTLKVVRITKNEAYSSSWAVLAVDASGIPVGLGGLGVDSSWFKVVKP